MSARILPILHYSTTPLLQSSYARRLPILAVNFSEDIAYFANCRLRTHGIEHRGHEKFIALRRARETMQCCIELAGTALLFSFPQTLDLAPFDRRLNAQNLHWRLF